MRRLSWMRYAWPGLPQLWLRCAASGLVLALGCAVVLNLLLVSSFVWEDLLSAQAKAAGWVLVFGIWVAAGVGSYCRRSRPADDAVPQREGPVFAEALDEYLAGNWPKAEFVLRRLVRRDSRDVDARLMLATICRHTDRPAEAEARLDELTTFDRAEKWEMEIRRERELLARRRDETAGLSGQPAICQPAAIKSGPADVEKAA